MNPITKDQINNNENTKKYRLAIKHIIKIIISRRTATKIMLFQELICTFFDIAFQNH